MSGGERWGTRFRWRYHLEIYERSFVNDPSVSLAATTPFQAIAVGDFLEHRGFAADNWQRPPAKGEGFRVKAVVHGIWDIPDKHIGHKLMVCVEIGSTAGVA